MKYDIWNNSLVWEKTKVFKFEVVTFIFNAFSLFIINFLKILYHTLLPHNFHTKFFFNLILNVFFYRILCCGHNFACVHERQYIIFYVKAVSLFDFYSLKNDTWLDIVSWFFFVLSNKIGESGEGHESFESEKDASIGSRNSNEGIEDDSDDSPSPPAGTSSPTQIANGQLNNMPCHAIFVSSSCKMCNLQNYLKGSKSTYIFRGQ